jgi:GNAT superfamily N-acetyltransferase
MPRMTAALAIHPLSPERLPDFFAFFEGEAFADNPDWADCYCQCYLEDHRVVRWADRTAAQNGELARKRMQDGTMRGLLAYRDGKVVGWCNAAPRALMHWLDAQPRPDAADTGAITCFVVAPGARGQGVATALLDAACAQLRGEGIRRIEAFPRTETTSNAANHYGPLAMYLDAGFAIVGTDAKGSMRVEKELA